MVGTVNATQGPSYARSFSSVGVDLIHPELDRTIRAGLAAVEQRMHDAVASDDSFVADAAMHLVDAGGKRFRPLLVALAAQFGDRPTAPEVYDAAVVVELTHLATLYHDDVMDEAPVRRGAPSANTRWTNTVAILTGDYLFARASDLVADLGPEAVRIQARTFARLVQGQIRETAGPRPGDDPIEHYRYVVAEKTGSLIATSARFGGLFSGADPATVDALAEYGEIIGVAFQLSDDILDIASESAESGKTPGTDLREGISTLPVLYALATEDATGRRLREIIDGPVTDNALVAEALDLLRTSAGMEQARQTLQGYADAARKLVARLPERPASRALDGLCTFVVERTG
jgi:heptaprenyl diphosphate synthase